MVGPIIPGVSTPPPPPLRFAPEEVSALSPILDKNQRRAVRKLTSRGEIFIALASLSVIRKGYYPVRRVGQKKIMRVIPRQQLYIVIII